MLAVLGRSWALCWRSWAALELGGLGPLLGLCWRSWAALGAYVGGLGPKNGKNMATLKMCLFLERERDLWPRGQSWGALGPYVGGLGPVLGLCWRSWAALGAYVGGLGPLLAPKLAVLEP